MNGKRVTQTFRKRLAASVLAVMMIVNVGVLQATKAAFASTLTSASDVMSEQTSNTASNHLFTFTTPSGVSDSETITIGFPVDFNTTGMTENDVDISDDGVQLTTASDCSGAEQASVAFAGDVVTITICVGDSGSIAATSVVRIAVGTNATNSGTGSEQIENPNSIGYFLVDIGGTFGDFASIPIVTTEVGSVDVGLTVSQGGGGGPGGGGDPEPTPEPEADTTAPVISGVDVVSTTVSSAVIEWSTDESATCSVDYGETTSYGDSVSEGSTGTSHSVEITGLSSDTEYFFLITCEDASGNASESGPRSFTTSTDPAPASLSSFSCSAGDGQIDFTWAMPSDEDLAGARINCSTSGYPSSSSEGTSVFTGDASTTSATVSALTNGTTYYCSGFAYDEADNEASGAVASCTPVDSSEDAPADETPTEEVLPEETSTTPDTVGPSEETPTTPSTDETGTSSEESNPGTTPTTEPATIPSGPTTTEGTGIESDDIAFSAATGSIDLFVSGESVAVIPGTAVTIVIPSSAVAGQTVEAIYLTVDGSSYILGTTESGWAATIMSPSTSGTYTVALRLVFTDGSVQDIDLTMQAVDVGYVYEVDGSTVLRVNGAVVSLLQSVSGQWSLANVSAFGSQSNPTTSASDGTFAWYADNGLYKVEVSKTGYSPTTSATFRVSNNIATVSIQLIAEVVPIEEPASATETPLSQVVQVAAGAVQTISDAIDDFRNTPEVQTAADIAIPTAVVLGTVAITVLATSFDLLPLLQYLLTSPFLFFARRKRKGWGVVYNAATKLPIDLAIVRLYHMPENRLVATRVTDKEGRYFFLAQPGLYRLESLKPSFSFPAQLVEKQKTDGDYLDVYHGEMIEVKDKNATIAANVPLDPRGTGNEHVPSQIIKRRVLRRLTGIIAPIGLILALAIMILRPSALTIGGFALQLALMLVSLRLAKPRQPKSWGIVYASDDNKPLAGTVVRIFEPQYNKLLETAVTDSLGRYSFLVGPASYFTTYEKAGYDKHEVRPIDRSQTKGSGEVAIDVAINKTQNKKPEVL